MVWRRLGFASLWLVLCSASASAQLVMAPGGGSDPVVRILDSSGSASSFLAYPAGFRGAVRVALGDVNGGGGGTAAGVGGSGGVGGAGGVAGSNGLSDPDGSGGAGAAMSTASGGGGGGGGGFGGAGGGGSTLSAGGVGAGGGGGSSHVPAGATSVAHQQGVRPGNGQVIISW